MSSPAESDTPVIEEGHVRLILLLDKISFESFHLDIPLDVIKSLCLKPLKYLLFLGWCILGVEGVLAIEPDGDEVDTDGILSEHEIYYYNAENLNEVFIHAVDLEVIRDRSQVTSTTSTQEYFCEKVQERDPFCVWTGVSPEHCIGMHIIPHGRGSEWLSLIVKNRPKYSENVTTPLDIDDLRNGLLANKIAHDCFDRRQVAVLKTPNHILRITDVPPQHQQSHIRSSVSYPVRHRYTMQWLTNPDAWDIALLPNNLDAAFKTGSRKPKPSDLLLHYTYGCAAVKQWGINVDILKNLANPPRPTLPVPAPMGASKSVHDRTTLIERRKASRTRGVRAGKATARAGAGEIVESEGQVFWDHWDEDDVVLFFWGNTPAAKERHRKKVQETTQHLEEWRENVPQGLA